MVIISKLIHRFNTIPFKIQKDSFYKREGDEEMEVRKGRGQRDEERIKMCYIQVPTPQEECAHYVLHICTNKMCKTTSKRYVVMEDLTKVRDFQLKDVRISR